MGVSTSLYSGLSGLMAHQRRMDVIGNNIANVNTAGFKSSRVLFRNAFSQTLNIGTAPTGVMGGVNPIQVGLGTTVGSTSTNYGQGSIETTGVPSDLAVSGSGFFIVKDGNGQSFYTRDGSFNLGSDQILTNSKGMVVQGWMADDNFDINPSGATGAINIQLGSMRLAKATQNVDLTGNLNSAGDPATAGSSLTTQALTILGGAFASVGTKLVDLRGPGNAIVFSAGDTITLNADKGGRAIEASTYTVDPNTSTVGGLMAWLEGALGINKSAGVPDTPGVTIGANGVVTIKGDYGSANDISDVVITSTTHPGGTTTQPFTITKGASATGASGYTPFTVYDSLGKELNVSMTFVLESKSSAGDVWRWYAESPDTAAASRVIGTGTVTFDDHGVYQADSGDQFTIDRAGSGAETPLTIKPDFSQITQLDKGTADSEVALMLQDGAPEGTLNEYAIGSNGVVNGIFTNGLVATLAQISLATFANNEGLYSQGDNLYSPGPNAGSPQIGAPGAFGSGTVVSGALEQSNVDLASEFVNLIVTQTGYTANSRVITTSNNMLTELLNTIR